ncbi:NAD-dependent succinate-semialdehyde dehydrogenase [Vibrio barjaei]|uniref:NAD-dependent succinate-semialdehyde dehydrogenase n=1 Tax=Vibrio barjaei TaxID=1676683 RepID=UPI0022844948|nr:NAD-dependent succinate-semialdehyde dehydrogenase [Vibrio barjaei]MCY9872210.1 NAD-dependent succinate-semialdehyde dehydrogenase [Vibrio barjaei]
MEYINNNELLAAFNNQTDHSIAVYNPHDESIVGYIPSLSIEDINHKIERSKVAQQEWQNTTASHRATILNKWFELVTEYSDELAQIMTLEQGKPLTEAKGEVVYGASFIKWFAEEAKRTYGDTIPTPAAGKRLMTTKQPIGVTASITPWNFPIAMITRKVAPALAAGCSCIVKPANQTPLSAYAIAELAYQAGLPKDLLFVINNHSSVLVGDLLCHHEDIKKLSFTGSTEVGRTLLKQTADTIKRTSMELGGNAPFVVFDDADIPAAVQGAIASKFRNAGQTCVCANRFYVQDAIYDEFVDQFVSAVSQLNVGYGLEAETHVGPLIDSKAKDCILALISTTLQQGAKLQYGGDKLSGNYLQPTVLTDVSSDMDIVQTEIFGPVAPVIRFEDESDLIRQCNDTIYGLASYFYTKDIQRAFRVADALEFGMVGINEGIISTEFAPFGGIKQSGFGREGAKQGIEEYLNTKYICFGNL